MWRKIVSFKINVNLFEKREQQICPDIIMKDHNTPLSSIDRASI
jgi:hypothetical protein